MSMADTHSLPLLDIPIPGVGSFYHNLEQGFVQNCRRTRYIHSGGTVAPLLHARLPKALEFATYRLRLPWSFLFLIKTRTQRPTG